LSSGTVLVNASASIGGNGTVTGGITLNGTIHTGSLPATLSTGAQVWNGGAKFIWTINNANGGLPAGGNPGWSLIAITGDLQINSTSLNPIEIDLRTLTSGNVPGALASFDPNTDQAWTIVTTTTTISSFTGDQFTVNTTGFVNATAGHFSVEPSGNSLVLHYTAVPEVSATGVGCAAVLVLAILMRRSTPRDSLS
jgi:hypothetical protein